MIGDAHRGCPIGSKLSEEGPVLDPVTKRLVPR